MLNHLTFRDCCYRRCCPHFSVVVIIVFFLNNTIAAPEAPAQIFWHRDLNSTSNTVPSATLEIVIRLVTPVIRPPTEADVHNHENGHLSTGDTVMWVAVPSGIATFSALSF
eukprot:COSAG02_NODE_99_length_37069_cov_24.910957_6_plen_111_part_00